MFWSARCDACERRGHRLCPDCRCGLAPPDGPSLRAAGECLDDVRALFSYEGTGRDLLRALKYANRRSSLRLLVDAAAVDLPPGVDVVVPVPPHRDRLRRRGYDLPALVAHRLALTLHVPVARPLLRIDDGAQHERPGADRSSAAQFSARRKIRGRLLLVDDVITTGSTIRSCATQLRQAGADAVAAFALALTPRPSARQ